ncbi:MAG: endo-1,4-beta-xylanase [Bacteroidota bacterium]|jgi:GH35 family endo-1,4-beta-xylanase
MKRIFINPEENCKNWFVIMALLMIFSTCSFAQTQTNVPALKDVYAKDFYIGCLLSYRNIGFSTDPYVPGQSAVTTPDGGNLIKFHMNSMGPGNNMKPQYTVNIDSSANAYIAAATQAQKDSINVHPVVRFNGDLIAQLNWAQRQGFKFRGHTLVWYSQTPGTAFFRTGYAAGGTYVRKDTMIARMDGYIKDVIRLIHEGWPGLLLAIDVVNEAVNDDGTDRATGNEWYTTFGDNSYIMKAFEITRKYTVQYSETQIQLYYNDYNTSTASKANGIVRVCGPIFRAGYLDGIGMQEHDGINSPTAAQWIASYNKFDTICTVMAVTELDVNSTNLTQQANQFGVLLKCFVERSYRSGRGKIVNVTKDGLNDANTFNANSSIWDANDQCKPSFFEFANVGINYHALDSLLSSVDTLQQNKYTAESWSSFAGTLAFAQNAKTQNYSASQSTANALGQAKDSLMTAINGLVPVVTDVHNVNGNNPRVFALSQNYPNPFNPTTQIKYSIPQNGYVSLKVYNLLGAEVATLFACVRQSGNYTATFNGDGLASGVYFYRMQANNFLETKKLILLR